MKTRGIGREAVRRQGRCGEVGEDELVMLSRELCSAIAQSYLPGRPGEASDGTRTMVSSVAC